MAMDAREIERLIKARIPDAEVTIRDLAGDGDHYAATVIAESFRGKSRVQQHQIVYEALKGEMGGMLHALALQTGMPESVSFAANSGPAPLRHARASNQTGHDHEHRAIHRQRSEEQRRGAVHEGHAAVPDVRLLRPGRADPRLPRRALQGPQRARVRRAARTASRPIRTGRPSRSSTSRASSSAAATSSARCSRPASCKTPAQGKGRAGEGRRRRPERAPTHGVAAPTPFAKRLARRMRAALQVGFAGAASARRSSANKTRPPDAAPSAPGRAPR